MRELGRLMLAGLAAGSVLVACGTLVGIGALPGLAPDASPDMALFGYESGADESAPPKDVLDGSIGDTSSVQTSEDTMAPGSQDASSDMTAQGPGDGADGATAVPDAGCATSVFAVDFDDGGLPWIQLNGVPPGIIEVSDAQSRSPPFSMFINAPALGNFNPYVFVRQYLPSPRDEACLDLDLFVPSSIEGASSDIIAFGYTDGSGFLFYLNGAGPNALACKIIDYQADAGTLALDGCPNGLPLDQWFHLSFDVTMPSAGQAVLTVHANDSLVFGGSLRPAQIGSAFNLQLGSTVDIAADASWSVFMDNVVVSEHNPLKTR